MQLAALIDSNMALNRRLRRQMLQIPRRQLESRRREVGLGRTGVLR